MSGLCDSKKRNALFIESGSCRLFKREAEKTQSPYPYFFLKRGMQAINIQKKNRSNMKQAEEM